MDLKETIRTLEIHNDHQKGKNISHPELHEMQLKIVVAVDEAINYLKEKKLAQEQVEKWKEEIAKIPLQFIPEEPKITLRDHFAGLAMQSFIDRRDISDNVHECERAYAVADKMIEVRNKTK